MCNAGFVRKLRKVQRHNGNGKPCVELRHRLVLVIEAFCHDPQVGEREVDVGLQDLVVVSTARYRVVSDLLLRNVRSLREQRGLNAH